jgi:hypothetical protein
MPAATATVQEMPLYDWTRVPDNVFHNFLVAWLGRLAGTLNGSALPRGYLARVEQYVGPVSALEVESSKTTGRGPGLRLESTATIDPPRFDVRRQRRIAIFSARDERRLAVIEVVSPGNKDAERRTRWFEEKLLDCLASGLHVLLIDLLPATPIAPGLAAAVARDLGCEAVPEDGQAVTSFECQARPPVVRVYHQPVNVGKPLPSSPLFLEPGWAVEVPLESTYEASFAWLPAPDRERLV